VLQCFFFSCTVTDTTIGRCSDSNKLENLAASGLLPSNETYHAIMHSECRGQIPWGWGRSRNDNSGVRRGSLESRCYIQGTYWRPFNFNQVKRQVWLLKSAIHINKRREINLKSFVFNELFKSVNYVEESFFIVVSSVTTMEPPIRSNRFCCCFGVIKVA